jgi:hypothetical protein
VTWSKLDFGDRALLQTAHRKDAGTRLFTIDESGVRREIGRVPDDGVSAVHGDAAYFLGLRHFKSLRLEDGRVLASAEADYRHSGYPLRFAEGHVAGTEKIDGDPERLGVVIVDASTGRVTARLVHPPGFHVFEDSTVHRRFIYCPLKSDDRGFHALAVIDVPEGKVARVIEDPPGASPVQIADGVGYWMTPDPRDPALSRDLVAVELSSAKVLHRVSMPLQYPTAIRPFGDRLYLAGYGLACLRRQDLSVEWSLRDPRFWVDSLAVNDRFLACLTTPEDRDRLHLFDLEHLRKASDGAPSRKLLPSALRSPAENAARQAPSAQASKNPVLNARAGRALKNFSASTLVPEGREEEDLVDAIVAGVDEYGLIQPVPGGPERDVLLLSFVNPRLVRIPDPESIHSPRSFNAFLEPMMAATAKILGITGFESVVDGERNVAEFTLAWGAEEHTFEIPQDSDYANLEGLVKGLNRFTKRSGYAFYVVEAGDPLIGFLTPAEAALLRKKGVEI